MRLICSAVLLIAIATAQQSPQYSELRQINRENVNKIEVAWKYDTGDAFAGSEDQCRPLFVDGVLYLTSPKNRLLALDAADGHLLWSFDPAMGQGTNTKHRHRGLTMYAAGSTRRLFYGHGPYLWAVDARTGKPVPSFGKEGRIDLREGLGRDPRDLTVGSTSPGVVWKDMLILGSIVPESLPSAPGDIRAFDVNTGQIRWSFHTIPHPGEFGYKTWPADGWKYLGGANSWPGVTLDQKRGIVFVPTGSSSFDFYGANRTGDNLFANCLIALKADTGERIWHFQFVKHDVWDRDLPSAPTLVTVRRGGRTIDAVAQITKQGYVYVFNRETGASLFDLVEREVPASDVDGEVLSRRQILPATPAPYARQEFTEGLVTDRTAEAHKVVLERLRAVRSGPQWTPPSRQGTVVFPGFDGGGEWGGPAFDPESGVIYVNSNEMPWILRLVPRNENRGAASGRTLYNQRCAGCHREDLGGSPPEFPSLRDIGKKHSAEEIRSIIVNGAGRMPGFRSLGDRQIDALLKYVSSGESVSVAGSTGAAATDLKYGIDGYNKFLDPDGYPAVKPPWGTLNAINLNTGQYVWKIPFGEIPKSGLKDTGSENYGGGVVTAGGLLFIGATNHDAKMHAYDKSTGKLVWEYKMDAAGNATPVVYEWKGRQYVVIIAGGGKSGAPSGGSVYAWALLQSKPAE